MVVKFQVERRPVGPTGKVYYGREKGDGVAILSNPTHMSLGGTKGNITAVKPLGRGQGQRISYVPMGNDVPPLTVQSSTEDFSHVVEQIGEPWLVHSSHHSVDSAIEAAAPLASAIGAANVRIIKVLNHTTEFKLN